MQLIPVESSAFIAIGYDAATRRLEILFKDDCAYEYLDVPAQVHAALMLTSSKGRYFNAAIRGRYRDSRCTSCEVPDSSLSQ